MWCPFLAGVTRWVSRTADVVLLGCFVDSIKLNFAAPRRCDILAAMYGVSNLSHDGKVEGLLICVNAVKVGFACCDCSVLNIGRKSALGRPWLGRSVQSSDMLRRHECRL